MEVIQIPNMNRAIVSSIFDLLPHIITDTSNRLSYSEAFID